MSVVLHISLLYPAHSSQVFRSHAFLHCSKLIRTEYTKICGVQVKVRRALYKSRLLGASVLGSLLFPQGYVRQLVYARVLGGLWIRNLISSPAGFEAHCIHVKFDESSSSHSFTFTR